MSSSDDEDCYGNIAKKLQCLKNNYRPEKLLSELEGVQTDKEGVINVELPAHSKDDSFINLLEDVPEIPDPPVSVPKKKKVTRRSARNSGAQETLQDPKPPAASRRGRKRKSDSQAEALDLSASSSTDVVEGTTNDSVADMTRRKPTSGRVRARGGRRGRGSRRNIRRDLIDAYANTIVYSIGNTLEYPDTAENVPIFSKNEAVQINAAESIDLSSSFAEEDENEELSVKVCWHQTEYIKFNIRKFQKLSQIFDYFSNRESVPADKLLFTLKGKILRPDDTPDSIQYNIAHFIDGGVVSSSISAFVPNSNKENTNTSGILIKFQCQNSKKPFETHIEADQKLSTAMIKCAEHFELPFAKLRFLLDGDTISAISTPREHGLDHGDCIDVKITA